MNKYKLTIEIIELRQYNELIGIYRSQYAESL